MNEKRRWRATQNARLPAKFQFADMNLTSLFIISVQGKVNTARESDHGVAICLSLYLTADVVHPNHDG